MVWLSSLITEKIIWWADNCISTTIFLNIFLPQLSGTACTNLWFYQLGSYKANTAQNTLNNDQNRDDEAELFVKKIFDWKLFDDSWECSSSRASDHHSRICVWWASQPPPSATHHHQSSAPRPHHPPGSVRCSCQDWQTRKKLQKPEKVSLALQATLTQLWRQVKKRHYKEIPALASKAAWLLFVPCVSLFASSSVKTVTHDPPAEPD